MTELKMEKDQWIPMTREEWHVAMIIGKRREYLNRKHRAREDAVDKKMLDPFVSMRRTIRACFCELAACKVHNVYPDLQNADKLPWDLIIKVFDDRFSPEWIEKTIDVKTPSYKDCKWVVVPEKCKPKACDLYVFTWAEVPEFVFDQKVEFIHGIPNLDVSATLMGYHDWEHSVITMGWITGDDVFQGSNRARRPNSKKGYFVKRSELYTTKEEALGEV